MEKKAFLIQFLQTDSIDGEHDSETKLLLVYATSFEEACKKIEEKYSKKKNSEDWSSTTVEDFENLTLE